IRPDMKTRVLSVDLADSQGGVLHFGRKRMRNWITKDAQANRWINVARYLAPLFQIAERVTLGGVRFHEPLSLQSFRAKSRNPVVEPRVVSRAPSTPLRFAQDDIHWAEVNVEICCGEVVDPNVRR